MVRGAATAALSAGSVISWNIILLVVVTERLKTWQRCHAIASPSRSSSVARMTSAASAMAARSFATWAYFDDMIANLMANS